MFLPSNSLTAPHLCVWYEVVWKSLQPLMFKGKWNLSVTQRGQGSIPLLTVIMFSLTRYMIMQAASLKKRQHEQWMNENSNEKSVHHWCKGPGTVWGNRLEANCSLYFSLSGLFWISQLISARRHPASPLCPLLLRLAPGIPWGGALCLLICFHHTLPLCSPHGLCLLSLLRERKEKSSNTLKELLME